jgi:hypothetical protein
MDCFVLGRRFISLQSHALTAGHATKANSRFQPKPGLSAAQVVRLKLKWAFGFPNRDSAYAALGLWRPRFRRVSRADYPLRQRRAVARARWCHTLQPVKRASGRGAIRLCMNAGCAFCNYGPTAPQILWISHSTFRERRQSRPKHGALSPETRRVLDDSTRVHLLKVYVAGISCFVASAARWTHPCTLSTARAQSRTVFAPYA